MSTPTGPTGQGTANRSTPAPGAKSGATAPNDEREQEREQEQEQEPAGHLGVSLVLAGVMLIFFVALLGAEHRELQTWTHSLRGLTARTGSGPAAIQASALASVDAPFNALDAQYLAKRGFEHALFAADIGVALATLALVLRRGRWWFIAMVLTLACLITSTHQFTVARAQLTQSESSPR